MVYTCYEMIRDCRAGRPEGWSHLLARYLPLVRRLLAHYATDEPALLERVLLSLRDPAASLFQSLDPAPERAFVAELRQWVLAHLGAAPPEIELELPALAAALERLTLLEKQATWLEAMRYGADRTGAMLRMSAATVNSVRTRAGDLVRARMDNWRSTLLTDNGLLLGRAAAAAGTPECLQSRSFLDALDGRMTWRDREALERHVTACWHCIDHYCRIAEAIELLRDHRPLTEAEAEPYRRLLGIEAAKPPGFWKRFTGRV